MSLYPPLPIVKKKQKHYNHIGATSGLLYVFCGCVCMCENPAVFARLCVYLDVCASNPRFSVGAVPLRLSAGKRRLCCMTRDRCVEGTASLYRIYIQILFL